VFWSDDDDGFIAIAPDLPGCSAFGKNQAEALTELQDAIAAWIEAAKAVGNPVPEPSRSPEVAAHSGRILLRTTHELHGLLAQAAEVEGVSLNHYINQALSMAIARRFANPLLTAQRKVESTAWKPTIFQGDWEPSSAMTFYEESYRHIDREVLQASVVRSTIIAAAKSHSRR
jgi:predicted RNase H-like HicB family nuclease